MSFIDALLVIFVILVEISFVSLSIAAVSMAPWLPTKKDDVKRALKIAGPKPGEIIYDLGSGTGTVIFEAAKEFRVKAIGIERAFPLHVLSKIKSLFIRSEGEVKFVRANLFKSDIGDADIVYVFGLPGPLSQKVLPLLEKQLKPGTRVVSYVFSIKGWEPDKVDWPPGGNPIYLYKIVTHPKS